MERPLWNNRFEAKTLIVATYKHRDVWFLHLIHLYLSSISSKSIKPTLIHPCLCFAFGLPSNFYDLFLRHPAPDSLFSSPANRNSFQLSTDFCDNAASLQKANVETLSLKLAVNKPKSVFSILESLSLSPFPLIKEHGWLHRVSSCLPPAWAIFFFSTNFVSSSQPWFCLQKRSLLSVISIFMFI